MSNMLTNRIALVTGGSRGLGKAISHALAQKGVKVVVNYANRLEDAQQTVDSIRFGGGQAVAIRGDVTSEEEVRRLVVEAEEYWGETVDILVNNAAGRMPLYAVEDCTWDIYLDQLHFFVKAPLLLTKAVISGMKKKSAGTIINIGSEVVQLGSAKYSNYVTAKSAMIGMTRSWAKEFGPFGIRCNLVAPGFIPVERHAGMKQEAFDRYVQDVPLGRMGEAADIAETVAFLASDAAKFITGQCLTVNGGKTNSI